MKIAFYHPKPDCQFSWNCFQLGLLIFPLTPFVGFVSIMLAVLVTWVRQYRSIIRRPINWGFGLLSFLLFVSACFANDKTAAFVGLFNLLPFFLLFTGLGFLIQTTAQLRHIAWILVLGSVPVVIMGFGQLFLGWNLQIQVLWILLDWTIAPGGSPPGRMAALFMHANIFAAYLAIAFTLGIGLLLEQWQARSSGSGEENTQFPTPIIFLTLSVIADFAALILTNSRNGWAIAIIACLAFALYQGWRLLVGGVAAVVTTVLLSAFAPPPIAQVLRQIVPAFFWARLNDQMYPDRPLALMRKTQWQFAWSLTQQRPWTGWGLRNFTDLYKAQMNIDLGHPHNLFLMFSAETGLPSTFLFFGLLSWILFAGSQILWKSNNINQQDKLIFFSYLVVFGEWLLFNTVDVTLFDFRLNTLSWVVMAAIAGNIYYYNQHKKFVKEDN
ncbi:O-antigen ligase family protein [Nostoc sp. PCC 7120 = FACHB-418]|nr:MULTISPECIES: O-antigen ligase [Nostocaceae]HBW28514.1 O-antigen ligase family protein [Nostoc sp. UBA8866]MBD2174517.1 O-antigen ligase family protein [Anabaena cylindrica FACHB-318]MBD2266277.1 O-antigen ligase family protein [Anabaena sp. FACHB-709]MBD2275652.1 O-antigen ligase family protein [Nostoc sp. PCC 7120 = FACHB-418]MBD2286580.1 O-antigen ligase family protein [Anabaena cylindrica FACHB-170]